MDRAQITPALAAKLVAAQFPQWAELAVTPVDLNGWDNTTFRLGDELSVRLPSAEAYVAQIDKEHRWLPILGRQLPLPIPQPVAKGRPDCGYPWPWSIYRWIDGEPASSGRIDDHARFARDLASFLVALQAADPTDGPPPGAHSFHRGGSLDTYDAETRESIELLAERIDAQRAIEVWDAALSAQSDGPPVWVHGDVSAANLLVADGQLHAVLDFGCSAVGDPACDLVMAWTFFDANRREVFRRGLPAGDACWARGRGWALWKALITIADGSTSSNVDSAPTRFGWARRARDVVEEVVADHLATG